MLDLLPCPFCGSSKLILCDSDRYVMCGDNVCAGHLWVYVEKWQGRKKTDDQLKIAYAQFEASLKAEKEKIKITQAERLVIDEAVSLAQERGWINGPAIHNYVKEFRGFIQAVRRYKEKP